MISRLRFSVSFRCRFRAKARIRVVVRVPFGSGQLEPNSAKCFTLLSSRAEISRVPILPCFHDLIHDVCFFDASDLASHKPLERLMPSGRRGNFPSI